MNVLIRSALIKFIAFVGKRYIKEKVRQIFAF